MTTQSGFRNHFTDAERRIVMSLFLKRLSEAKPEEVQACNAAAGNPLQTAMYICLVMGWSEKDMNKALTEWAMGTIEAAMADLLREAGLEGA